MRTQRMWRHALVAVLTFLVRHAFGGSVVPELISNSVEMKLVSIPAGSFQMGQEHGGDADERPVHRVIISTPFFLATTEVTNAQYEQFDPGHKRLRGKRGLSKGDDEAVVFVSWHDAMRFCEWLSKKEGKPYRLPTEAEWEYACRAGTTTVYHAGDKLPRVYHRAQEFSWDPKPVDLTIGRTPPNPWGLHDMHGNVEEWCLDWYGPYESGEQTDPVGREAGEMKVTRGGSHNTDVAFLRSANRLGTLPDDKHWLIGFRVVCGEPSATKPLPPPEPPRWARDVPQAKHDWVGGPDPAKPYFRGPRRFVHIPPGADGPLYARHNHCPSITWCANGDLLACWFSTRTEPGREMTIAASRLRRGAEEWDPAAEFFKAPDRNMTGSALWHDGEGTLYHFNGLEAGGGWANLALVLRTSADNGITWTARLINPHHEPRNQIISGTSRTREGFIIQPCDAVYGGNGGTAIHVSRDGGKTWVDPGAGTPKPDFPRDPSGATIAGIHACVAQLSDGRLLAFGRGDNRLGSNDNIGDHMPQSVSPDFGATWHYSSSPWPPIGGNQRAVLLRLREGPLLFVSFSHDFFKYRENLDKAPPFIATDAAGRPRRIHGMFAALSFDDGATWPVRRPVTPGEPPRTLKDVTLTGSFLLDDTHAEPRGYLAATQTPDGVIHLISSGLHYRLNLAWLQAGTTSKAER
ncbi:MAG TPA: SUMF1/EgtB/PvdO family nonheme iron enzyme [Planctomycetota bacterium]|nr:SUMF1/EgtB/PvdO family nonheme iron enzyme [Planctomycetota bacterium]